MQIIIYSSRSKREMRTNWRRLFATWSYILTFIISLAKNSFWRWNGKRSIGWSIKGKVWQGMRDVKYFTLILTESVKGKTFHLRQLTFCLLMRISRRFLFLKILNLRNEWTLLNTQRDIIIQKCSSIFYWYLPLFIFCEVSTRQ